MRAILIIIFLAFISSCFCQQTEQTFIVKKRVVESKKEFPKIFDLKLADGRDTLCNSIFLDLTPAVGYYDSISLVNLRIMDKEFLSQNKRWYVTTTTNGHAIISFYKKQKDGSSKLIYFRNWVIHCLDRYSK